MIDSLLLAIGASFSILTLVGVWCIHENLRRGYYITRRPPAVEKYDSPSIIP